MALYLNDPDATGLAAGTAVTTSNSGGSTGGTANTAFSTVTNGPTIDTVLPPANQSKVYNFSAAASTAQAALVQCSITSTTTASGGTFLTLTGYPSTSIQLLRLGGTGTNFIGLTIAGKLYCTWNSGAQYTSTVTLSLNKRYWISTGMTIATSGATFTFELYDGVTGALLDKYTTTAANTGSTAMATFAVGKISTGGTMPTFYLSGIRAVDNSASGIDMPSYTVSAPKPVATYTFDEGTAAAAVAVATTPGVLAVSGTCTYQVSAAQHSGLGVQLAANSYLQYATPNASDGIVSVYCELAALPTATSQLFGFGSSVANAANPAATTGARMLITSAGLLQVQAGSVITSTGVTVAGGQPFRVDFEYDDTSGALGVIGATSATAMVYAGADLDTTTVDGSATSNGGSNFGSGNAAFFVLGGTGSNGQSLLFDTMRFFTDVSAAPQPFQPGYAAPIGNTYGSGTVPATAPASGTVNVTVPSGTLPGFRVQGLDSEFVGLMTTGAGISITPPSGSGWTQIASQAGSGSASNIQTFMFQKTAPGSQGSASTDNGATFAFTYSGNTSSSFTYQWQATAYRGAAAVDVVASNTATVSP